MTLLFFLFFECVLIYVISRSLIKSLFTVLMLCFRNRPIAVSLLLILLFPGTVIHELSHLFTAEILRVPTGKLTLVPESIRENDIRSGSVAIGRSDPFRRYAIGLAPLFWGITVLMALSYFLPEIIMSVFTSGMPLLQNMNFYWLLIIGYSLFAVSNTMFSSPADLKGFLPFALVVAGFVVAGYLLGLRLNLTGQVLAVAVRSLETLTQSLGIVLAVNFVLLAASGGLTMGIRRLTGHAYHHI